MPAPAPKRGADRTAGEFQVGEECVFHFVADTPGDGAELVAVEALRFEDGGVGADFLDRPHQVAHVMEEVDAPVDRSAAAGVHLLVPPGGSRYDAVRRPFPAADAAGDPELEIAEHPLIDQPAGGAGRLGVAHAFGDADGEALRRGGVDDLAGGADADRERFLDEDVLAGGDRVKGDRVVEADRREHQHGVDLVGLEQRPPVVVDGGNGFRVQVTGVEMRGAERVALVGGGRWAGRRTFAALAKGGGVIEPPGSDGRDPYVGESGFADELDAPQMGVQDARGADDAEAKGGRRGLVGAG